MQKSRQETVLFEITWTYFHQTFNHHTRVVVHGGNEAAMNYYSAETEALGFMLSWDMLLDNGIILQAWHGYHSSYNGCSDRCLATSHWLHGLVYGPFS